MISAMDTVWLIGRIDGEAATLPAALAAILPGAAVLRFETLSQAIVGAAAAPDLVVVVQHRPHESSPGDVEALIAAAPLAAFVVAAGPWCASAMRSERVWPESVVVPIEEAPDRIRRLKRAGDRSAGRLPLTAGRDEALLFDLAAATDEILCCHSTVAIATADAALRDFLTDLVCESGGVVVDEQAMAAGTTLLWDVTSDVDTPAASDRLAQWREAGCRVVALVSLPTSSLQIRLQKCGVDGVVSKPFSREALMRALAD